MDDNWGDPHDLGNLHMLIGGINVHSPAILVYLGYQRFDS